MVSGHGHPYGYPGPLSRYMDIRTGIRADIHVELSVLRTVQTRLLIFDTSVLLKNCST